jgi:hypothetical protein
VGTGTITATEPSASGNANATVHFAAPGPIPTGVALAVTNGNGGGASPPAGDSFYGGDHYLAEETSGHAADDDGTPAEAVVQATLMSGGSPLVSGVEPYAIIWTIQNTGSQSLFVDSVTNQVNLAGFPPNGPNVVCTSSTPTVPPGSPSCSPGSNDLDTDAHFSNPLNPGTQDNGIVNGSMPAFATQIAGGGFLSFTTYMIGANNNAQLVVDGATGLPVSATVTAQLAIAQVGSSTNGANIGSSRSASMPPRPIRSPTRT